MQVQDFLALRGLGFDRRLRADRLYKSRKKKLPGFPGSFILKTSVF